MKDHQTIIDGLKIYYTTSGNPNKRTLMFLHAWGASINGFNNMTNFIKVLSEHFFVIAPEHPGFIRSETPEKHWNYEEYAKFLNKFLDFLKVEKTVIVGNSFGGGIGTVFAKYHPQKIEKLILIDSVVSSEYPETIFVLSLLKNNIKILESKYIPNLIKKLTIWSSLGTPIKFINKEDIKRKLIMLKGEFKVKVNYSLLKVPVILLWGKNDLKTHPIKYARDIAKKNPKIKLIEYEGDVPTIYKEPKRIVKLILEVLNKR